MKKKAARVILACIGLTVYGAITYGAARDSVTEALVINGIVLLLLLMLWAFHHAEL